MDKIKGAYSGSLIQQNFGETPDKHGYLLWDFTDKNNLVVTERDILNSSSFVIIDLLSPSYDDLSIDIPNPTEKMKVRVDWNDYSAFINKENESKIKTYLNNKYSGIVEIKFSKHYINETDVVVSDEDIISKKIYDLDVQKGYFNDYLTEMGLSEEDINYILDLDKIINEKVELGDTTYNNNWYIKQLWCDNFQSYDNFNIDFENHKGILQIVGKNQQGKTTIFKLICYVLYGETLETKKREKNGDIRYINNKRDYDYAEGGIIINISGKDYCIVRRTEKNVSKNNVVSVKTNVEFYKVVNGEIDKETSVSDSKTIKDIVESTIGDMSQFLRLVFTTSDTLNDLLDYNPSVFKDSILYDLGMDIFDKKLSVFKEYMKELKQSEEKIIVDIDKTNETINKLNNDVVEHENSITNIQNEIESIAKRISNGNKHIDSKQKELHLIDDDVKNLSESSIQLDINNSEEKIKTIIDSKSVYEDKLKTLKKEYDEETYNDLKIVFDTNKNKIQDLKYNIKESRLAEIEIQNNIDRLKTENNKYQTSDTFESNDILLERKKKQTIENKISTLENNNINITNNGKDIKSKIEQLKKDLEETDKEKMCLACGQDMSKFGDEYIKNVINKQNSINEKINELENKLLTLRKDFSKNLTDINENKELLVSIDSKINDFIEIEKTRIYELLSSNNDKIILLGEELKSETIKQSNYNREIETINLNLEDIVSQISELEKDKLEVDEYKQVSLILKEFDLKIKSEEIELKQHKMLLDKYLKFKSKIEENEQKLEQLNKFREALDKLNGDKENLINQKYIQENSISQINNNIQELKDKIVKYQNQVKIDFLRDTYQKMIHRDGIPTMILKNLIPMINAEIETLMTNQDFTMFFDDDIQLKMYHKISSDSLMSALEGSGAERTFISVVLKVALNKMNNKNKPDFIMFDEIMGKLVDENVENFISLLQDLKKSYNYIFVVDHNHTIFPDYIINVEKDDNYISHLTIE